MTVFLLAPIVASANTLIVNADGSGLYPTIQAAVDASVDGDEIRLTNGMFTGLGNNDINTQGKAIIIGSQELDAKLVIIVVPSDGVTRAFSLSEKEESDTIIESITIRGGGVKGTVGTGIINCLDASPTIRNCVFTEVQSHAIEVVNGEPIIEGCLFANCSAPNLDGGIAIYTWYDYDGLTVIRDCVFKNNSAMDIVLARLCDISNCVFEDNEGTPISFIDSTIDSCLFINNSGEYAGAILGSGEVRDCLFSENTARNGGSALSVWDTAMFVESCTFVNNLGSELIRVKGSKVNVSNSIIAFNQNTTPIISGNSEITCTDIYGNTTDWLDVIGEGVNGNISLEPLFCNANEGNYYLYSNSPCAPENSNGCDLIGLYGVDCKASSVDVKSWSQIKALYR
jgi:hypothetical protein